MPLNMTHIHPINLGLDIPMLFGDMEAIYTNAYAPHAYAVIQILPTSGFSAK